MSDPKRRPIERIREALMARCEPDLAVSRRLSNYFFEDGLATEADVAVRRGEEFLLVVAEDSLPRARDQVISVWLRFADEVWMVDLRGKAIIAARKGQPTRTVTTGELSTATMPEVALRIENVFAPLH